MSARVTIGMPVYNGAATLSAVLEALLSQTFKEFVLLISDNASTDATEEICQRFMERDKRISYVRQPENIGAERNFDYVLQHANTEYFMWAAADDLRSENFLEANLRFLEENKGYLGSTSPTRFEDGVFDPIGMGDQTRDEDDPMQRIDNFFGVWHSNGRYYSLFRRDAIKDWRAADMCFLASDWFFVMSLLRKGKLKRLDEGFVLLGREGISNGLGIFSRYRKYLIHWAFPFYELFVRTFALLRGSGLGVKFRVLWFLFKINFVAVRLQIKFELKKRAGL
ncbi:glycosyltransferase family 2 protein [Pseudomonas gingeri]|nr:glycosyltransferase family 2 protein [Pseudomonas gingeri]NWA04462.1 glycosyltransferase family 2 protein [Pseudomonas gingeri]NWA15561.1 glycosyltransferase family 2 protein [Pseudomonas gingeri]NWA58267.1 glycosyltransferase family 2 protein [Pseudomonas gingeri]NWA96057.1 glycosyltransferase family 2 protein [Pseudomonas gingeri]NWB04591.1 glycosyltransferase family 2 protein [Pseudomonas gingeri]